MPVRAFAHLVTATSLFRNVVFAAVVVAVVAFVWREARDDSIYVEPILVPPALAERGVTPDALTTLVVARVGRIVTDLGTVPNLPAQEVRATTDVREIHVVTLGPSVQAVGRQIRRLFGYSDTRVSGVVTRSENGWHISMRDPNSHLIADDDVSEAKPVPRALVEAGAIALLRITNPRQILLHQYWHFYTVRDLASLRELEKTVDFLEQAAGMRESREVRVNRGLIALWRGDFAAAREIYMRLAHDYPSQVKYQLMVANAAVHLGRYDDANERLDVVIRSKETDPFAFPMAAEVALNLGRWRDALDLALRARRADPKDETVLWAAGEALNGLHRPGEAIALLDGWAMKSVDWFVSQQATLADSFVAREDVARLGEVKTLLVRDFPESADTWRVAGRLAELQGNLPEARSWYERLANSKLPEQDRSILIPDVMVKEGKADAAIPRIEAYLQTRPWDAGGHHSLAKALAASGRMAKADAEYAKVIVADPDNVAALNEWAIVVLALGRTEESRAKLASATDAKKRLAVPLDIPELRRAGGNRDAKQ